MFTTAYISLVFYSYMSNGKKKMKTLWKKLDEASHGHSAASCSCSTSSFMKVGAVAAV